MQFLEKEFECRQGDMVCASAISFCQARRVSPGKGTLIDIKCQTMKKYQIL